MLTKRLMPLLACMLGVACPLWGQIRDVGAGLGNPGQIRGVGQSSLDSFRDYSSGAPGSSGLGGTNVLNTPLTAGGLTSPLRSGDAPSLLDQSAGPSFSGRSFGPAGGANVALSEARQPQSNNYLMRSTYTQYVAPPPSQRALSSGLAVRQDVITSLVPQVAGLYAERMKDGEDRFKERQYLEAMSRFESASFVGHDDPESLLGLSHASFAMGSYATSSYYLCRAIIKVPNLAQLKLSPRGFYGSGVEYGKKLSELKDFTKENPQNANGWLLLAYYSWYDDPTGPASATQALGNALAASGDPRFVEAVEIFYEGMVATGKVTGKLTAASRPATEESKR